MIYKGYEIYQTVSVYDSETNERVGADCMTLKQAKRMIDEWVI